MSTRTAHDRDAESIHMCRWTLASKYNTLFSLLSLSLRIYMYVFETVTPVFSSTLSLPPPHPPLASFLINHITCLCCPFLFLISLPSFFVHHSFVYTTYSDEVAP